MPPPLPSDPPLEGAARTIGMALFALIGAASAVVFGALAVHLVPILEASGLALTTAVFLASLKGFAQVAGRIWEIALGHKLASPSTSGASPSPSCPCRSSC